MINIGDKVVTVRDNNLIVGVVANIHNFERGNLYIVNVGGELLKRREGELFPAPEEERKPKSDEITITREEFINTFMKCLTPDRYPTDDPTTGIALMVSGLIILHELETELFGEK